MKSIKMNRLLLTLVILVSLLLGAAFTGVMILNAAPAMAQSAGDDAGEVEDNEVDDNAEGPDVPITGTPLEQASAAALDYIGEGRVTGTEVGDEEGYYEVEVTLDNGRQVDVHLDQAFNVLGYEAD